MNLDHKEQRMKKLLEENIREGKIGTAIAITGSWGVGKTYFWNKFREDHKFKNKYIYVSLFGLESLGDLKTHIYSNIENNHSLIEIPRWIRGLPSILKDTRVSQFGVNASAKVFDSLMFHQVKNAIICFDDFERMSNKLDIKDVMGLANQLKLEKNCQVILILDEAKTEDENKKKYADYKEKLIDETIKITSVEPLIRANTEDLDEALIDLIVEFANEIEIHNFRFFQKVIKLYRLFLVQLPKSIAENTKKIILIRVLQGYFIDEFGISREFLWEDVRLARDEQQEDWSQKKIKTYESLKSLNYYFVYQDQWLIEFKKWFDQNGEPNFDALIKLANSDQISEKNNQNRNLLNDLMEEWRDLEIDNTFNKRLFETASNAIGVENLDNLSFYCNLLMEFGDEHLSNELQIKINQWLLHEYDSKGYLFVNDQFSFGFNSENKFHIYLKSLQENLPYKNLPILIDIFHRYIFQNGWNSQTDSLVIEQANKTDWYNLLFQEIPKDARFKDSNKLQILKKILSQQISSELQPKINALIFEILEDEAQAASLEKKKNIEYVIKRLKE